MTPLERIEANPLPFATLLGIEIVSASTDALEARMVVKAEFCTLGAIAHGGAIMSFADTLGGAAAFISLADEAKGTATLESKTNFIAGAPAGSTLIGRCALVHRGRRTQVWQTRIETEEGKLIALTSQTQMTL
jgi:uncharacterized protein (TIGR00369 family)